MPLPDGGSMPWPPRTESTALALYDEWSAWYSGDRDQLARVYSRAGALVDPKYLGPVRSSQFAGGLVGTIARMFWGAPPTPGQTVSRLHVPVAGDIASTSADLLFSEPPAFIATNDTTTARLDALLSDGGIQAALVEAAEICSAYGGVYLRAGWDKAIADHPLVDVLTPDTAVPEWRRGRLSAVTFWSLVEDDNGKVWRHLERHEPGAEYHGLYRGSADELGQPMPLEAHPATAGYVGLVDDAGAIATGTTGLAVVYVPNMRPHRGLKGSALGRSDYQGIEPVMDSLDEAWTSWMRDLRLGKARIIVPEAYLQNQGRGGGARWDPEQEVYSTLNVLPKPDAPGSMITPTQFAIRVEEHERTTAALFTQAVRSAGYSAQTFGLHGEAAATATEVAARERRSFTTRARKINYWRDQLAALALALLEIDATAFGSTVAPERPRIEWPDGVATDPEAQGRTLQLIAAADAASIDTRVRMLHEDWDEPRIAAEVGRIMAESGRAVTDPGTFDNAPAGPADVDQDEPAPEPVEA